MPICNASRKKDGQPCTFKAKPGLETCRIHIPPIPVTPDNQCSYIKWNQERCGKRKVNGSEHDECSTHRNARIAKERLRIRRERFRDIWRESGTAIFRNLHEAGGQWHPANLYTRAAIWRMVDNGETEAEAIMAVLPEVHAMAARFAEIARRAALPDTRPELQRIADDSQNTHNRDVRRQTDNNVKLLLEISPPPDQNTMDEIRGVWSRVYRVPGRGVQESQYADIRKWYDTETCYTPSDWLYRKVLDCLWARIKLVEDPKIRHQLYIRLQQECAEAFGMCCEGHIGRLANVMVGFDDTFKPQIPVGLILQQKMAVIAQIENVEERFNQARALMAELNVPQEQAVPWLDAIVE